VVEHSSDDAVSPSVSNVTNTAIVQIPYPPILSSGSAVSSSSIVWTHTDASSNEDGFKLYDSIGNYLNFSNTAGTTTITETGLSPDTSYSRKAAAYNTYGTSFLSGIATARTLVNVPGAVTITRSSATTAVINSINSNSNPISAEYAVYQEVGVTCDGSGGNYVAANGSNNGSTAAWQALASWNGVTVSSLTPESEYVFCAKARNTALVETVFGPKSVTTGKIIPVTGDLTVDTNLNSATNFITRYKDGSDINRWIIGLDTVGVNSKNSSKVNLTTGSLTVNSNETLVAGELNLQGGSLFIPTGGRLAIGSKLWAVDRDVDGYPDVTNGEVKLWYGEVAPANAGVPQAYFRRKGFLSTLTTVDCNDNDDIHNAICCENVGVACATDGACCSSVCGTNADNDALFSASAGHTGTCKVAPALPYTDCNDALSGHSYTLPSATYYPDADLDTYTLSGVSSGTAICANAATWDTATEISIPGNPNVNTFFAQGTRKSSASVLADCNDTTNTIRTTDISGGTVTTSGSDKIHTFTTSGTLTVTCPASLNVQSLIVGGGGDGASGIGTQIGGGGGGVSYSASMAVTSGAKSVVVGGASVASSFNGTTAAGGSGCYSGNGFGCGTGSNGIASTGAGGATSVGGNEWYDGSTGVHHGGPGGSGYTSAISSVSLIYGAGGGGGGSTEAVNQVAPGGSASSGAGAGGQCNSWAPAAASAGSPAIANRGGGGGGGGKCSAIRYGAAGAGSSGIVIVRYANP
jgi:hypothetical protein